jgi:hypothetical protein
VRYYPKSIHEGGKLTSRLTERNWRKASALREHTRAGLIRVYIVGHRYFDRGAGPFMGPGGWVYEGRVVCECYPVAVSEQLRIPAIKSVAGWGFSGFVPASKGEMIEVSDPKNEKTYIDELAEEFWNVRDALRYANGEDGGALGLQTKPVRVSWTKSGYRLWRIDG